MAMDYGRAGQDYGDLTIQAVRSAEDQMKSVHGIGDAASYRMLGVTPKCTTSLRRRSPSAGCAGFTG